MGLRVIGRRAAGVGDRYTGWWRCLASGRPEATALRAVCNGSQTNGIAPVPDWSISPSLGCSHRKALSRVGISATVLTERDIP
jgi:hypothetical protein